MKPNLARIEGEMRELSRRMAPDAAYYWDRHRPRYRHFMRILADLGSNREFPRILDVGMGFEALILGRMFPESRVDCLGNCEDARYRPGSDFTFHRVDLNEAPLEPESGAPAPDEFDLIVFMEVLEHLVLPPDLVIGYLAARLRKGGILIVTTPNAVWLKNRLKMICGKNPFETLRRDRNDMGHIREYTRSELERAFEPSGLRRILLESRSLYRFNNTKDEVYSRIADLVHPSLRRSLVAVYRK